MNKYTPTKPVQKCGRKSTLNWMELNRSCENRFKSQKSSAGNLSLSKIITLELLHFVSILNLIYLRVCSKCALKITNAAERLNFIRENNNVPQENFITTNENGHELDKENQDPGILRFLKTSNVSWIGSRKEKERRKRAKPRIDRSPRSCGKSSEAPIAIGPEYKEEIRRNAEPRQWSEPLSAAEIFGSGRESQLLLGNQSKTHRRRNNPKRN